MTNSLYGTVIAPTGGDDTASLTAAFNAATVSPLPRTGIQAGAYTTTAPILFGKGGGADISGAWVEGANRYSTAITNKGAGQLAVVELNGSNTWGHLLLSNMALQSAVADGTQYGLLIPTTNISNLNFDRLEFQNVTTAIAVLGGNGGNGEFCKFSNFQTDNILNFFKNTAGQAYGMSFEHGFIYARAGGVIFTLDTQPGDNGGGMLLNSVNASVYKKTPLPTNSSLISLNNDAYEPVLVLGGRFEHITNILQINTGARGGEDWIVEFIGSTFTVDFCSMAKIPGVIYFGGGGAPTAKITFSACSFEASDIPVPTFVIGSKYGQSGVTISFEDCTFNGFASKPQLAAGITPAQIAVTYTRCTRDGVSFTG